MPPTFKNVQHDLKCPLELPYITTPHLPEYFITKIIAVQMLVLKFYHSILTDLQHVYLWTGLVLIQINY